ncbi:MAG TPA: alpha/beta fold hydrolase [Jatrophihabitans sp.]|nr:alpha/beta fold hydrolase [Jatrophihabitans sp.]
MSSAPVLLVDEPRTPLRALAVVLHGGRSRSTGPVRPTQLAVVRMHPFATALRRAGAHSGLGVARLRYTVRGWNDAAQSPVPDVRWALDRLAERFPATPVALVGHSMGGRAAVYTGGHESVRAVVGLAPWIEPGDPYEQLAERDVLFAHGDVDRMTSPPQSAAYARKAATVAASVSYISIRRERHAMLRRATLWHQLTTGWVLAKMCDRAPEETVGGAVANVVSRALAGEPTVVV